MPRLEEWEIKKYWEIFQGLQPKDNKLTGDRVLPVLKNSRLPEAQLARLWDLADIDSDGTLDFEEFCIAMRLIFDLVNGNMDDVPAELPAWLVPQLKRHLIDANKAVATGRFEDNGEADDTGDDDDTLSDNFDWYISPTDRATYESIYNANSDSYGRVRFESLNGLYSTLSKVPRTDILLAWNLVNPKQFETIDKDQALVFLHMLNQREHGKRIPRGVPALLRATFSKEVPRYDLSAVDKKVSEPSANDRDAFGASYLSKIGQGHHAERGTDFSATEGTDWEEVRLRRELADLEALLTRAQSETSQGASELAARRFEFEQLLKHKQERLAQARAAPGKNLADVRADVDLIESQVQTLEEFLARKQRELAELRAQLAQ